MTEPRTITLTLRSWILVGLALTVGTLLLAGQLVFIIQQRGIVDDQRHIALRQENRTKAVLEDADAFLPSREDALAAAREAGDALGELRRVLRQVLDKDAVGVTTRALEQAPQLLDAVDHAVAVLDRTYATLRASLGTQRESLDVQRRTLDLLERSYSVQRDVASIAGQTRDITTQLLQIARETLRHTESIDNKTGGPLPAGG
ncbi:MAG: hypothetical protein ACJ762_12140 [Solirubrobacteraceae bacterium]